MQAQSTALSHKELGTHMYLRRLAPTALLISTALALAGCGGTSAPAAAGATAGASLSASPAASQSPSPTPTPVPKAYTKTELAAVIGGLRDSQGKRLTAIPAAQLEEGIAASKEMMSAVVITPEACAAVADTNAQIPPGSTYAGGASQSTTVRAVTAVTLVAVKDPKILAASVETSAASSKKCAEFTMEVQGQKVTSKTVVLDVNTKADKSYAALVVQTLPNNQTMSTVLVMGVSGGLSATAVATGPDVSKGAAADLARLVDDALAQGGSRG